MARNITDKDIEKILSIIDGWQGKLTYEKLIDAAERPLLHRYTRQALHAHPRIREAIKLRKRLLKDSPEQPQVGSFELQKAIERIARLEAENQRLKQEVDQLLSQFARWASNAHSKGLSIEFLNRPLQVINRNATVSGV
jgi:type I restriction-modification system DNA methylase subunit